MVCFHESLYNSLVNINVLLKQITLFYFIFVEKTLKISICGFIIALWVQNVLKGLHNYEKCAFT
jgi:hypothetical protein